ncbi:hypothetical protein R1flu_022417 [Riccia fluitans]|uniref:Uncharacterized protein n=1 Tax=Riccia fluitans TaxID=41844 RepID=A0ABD1ZV66_9MARC
MNAGGSTLRRNDEEPNCPPDPSEASEEFCTSLQGRAQEFLNPGQGESSGQAAGVIPNRPLRSAWLAEEIGLITPEESPDSLEVQAIAPKVAEPGTTGVPYCRSSPDPSAKQPASAT